MTDECELCGNDADGRCKCSVCLEEGSNGRALCRACANNIFEGDE